jgi:hypothetical protein
VKTQFQLINIIIIIIIIIITTTIIIIIIITGIHSDLGPQFLTTLSLFQ